MMVGVVLLMGIYYKSKSIFLMQKNSYRFNFVQRSDIVIFFVTVQHAYLPVTLKCSIFLVGVYVHMFPSQMFYIPCSFIYAHVLSLSYSGRKCHCLAVYGDQYVVFCRALPLVIFMI